MKNSLHYFFLFSLLFGGRFAHTQIGNYFAAGSEWRVSIINHVYAPCIETDTRIYYLGGDSIVGTETYQKVMQRGIKELMWTGSSNPSTSCQTSTSNYNEFVTLVRQDNYKTYTYGNNQESLLFDYDLQIDDFIYTSNNDDSLQVVDIDTIQINGEERKLFYLEDDEHITSYKLVEGVAHFRGLLEPLVILPLSITTTMECYGINGVTEYSFLGSEPCAFNLGTKDIIADSDFMIYPVPSDKLLHIKSITGHSTPVSVTIFDLQGKSSQVSPYSEEINISHLQNGSYILSIQFENGNSINKLIVKN
jgi:hypothetical protein